MPLNVTLASSLLELEIDQHRRAAKSGGLKFKTGITSLDKDLPESLWRGGDIVALGTDGAGIKSESLSLELITTNLLAQHNNADTINPGTPQTPGDKESNPSIFIVAPPYQATATIQRLYAMLKARLQQIQTQPSKTKTGISATPTATATSPDLETTIKSYLSRVSLLQYLDISGLLESISEVLHGITESQFQAQGANSNQPHHHNRNILLLQGLPSTITATHRRTGTLQTAALLSSTMQGLRNIASTSLRSTGPCLVVLEVDIIWDGGVSGSNPTTPSDMNVRPVGQTSNPSTATTARLKSSFSSRTGKTLRININPTFARIIEDGTDVFVAVHDGEGRVERDGKRRIVECVRDERGFGGVDLGAGGESGSGGVTGLGDANGEINAFGSWGVWG